jgi:phosphatidylinositol alpha-1,6-mannosyltransferase
MRIALLSSTADPRDGYGNITVELSRALHTAGIDLTLFLPRSQKQAAADQAFPFPTSCTLPNYVFRIFERSGPDYFLPRSFKGFDLVHDLFAFPHCIVAAISSAYSGVPFVTGAQGTHGVRPLTYRPERWLLKWCYSRARGIAVPSQYTRDNIWKYAKQKYPIDIIHNGVRYDRFQKDVDTESIRKTYHGKRILLTVGGLWGRKGHDLVIRSLPEVLKAHPNTVYVIVGDGTARGELEQLATQCGVRDKVDFVGRKSGDELVAYFQACDVYVHTPRVTGLKFEGFGIVYLEASACGKPIVATDAGGIRDAVIDGVTGLIAGNEDVDGIAKRIVQILSDDGLAKRLGEQGKDYACEHDWSVIAQRYMEWYGRALSARS